MKSIKNYLLAILALATILTVVSCKKGNVLSKVASYTYKDGNATGKMTFYDNGTFQLDRTLTYLDSEDSLTIFEGTYTGDLNKDGAVITIEYTKETLNGKKHRLSPSESEKATVIDNGKKLDFYGVVCTRN